MRSPSTSRWRPHPWHGLEIGPGAPAVVRAYIEITPFDLVKYEIEKSTGYLRVDRPQLSSSLPPTLYGFIPRTWCDRRVASLSNQAERADGDPLDICVISERPISRAEVILEARVVGGLHMIDQGEADDKIVSVLRNDTVWSGANGVSDLPEVFVERLRHYFSTYKNVRGQPAATTIERVYGREHALRVVEASMEDYDAAYGGDSGGGSSS